MFKRKILILITTLTLAFAFVPNAQASIAGTINPIWGAVESVGGSLVKAWDYITGAEVEDTETTGGAAVLTSSDTAIYDKALSNLTGSLKPLSKKLVKGGVWLFWTLALIGLAVQGARAVFQGDGLISGPSILVRWLIVTVYRRDVALEDEEIVGYQCRAWKHVEDHYELGRECDLYGYYGSPAKYSRFVSEVDIFPL